MPSTTTPARKTRQSATRAAPIPLHSVTPWRDDAVIRHLLAHGFTIADAHLLDDKPAKPRKPVQATLFDGAPAILVAEVAYCDWCRQPLHKPFGLHPSDDGQDRYLHNACWKALLDQYRQDALQ